MNDKVNQAAAEKEIIEVITQEIVFYDEHFRDPNSLAIWIANRLLQEGMLK